MKDSISLRNCGQQEHSPAVTPPKQVYGSSKVWGKNIIKTFFLSIAEYVIGFDGSDPF